MLANTGPSDPSILIPSICSYNLLLKNNAVFWQVSRINFFNVHIKTSWGCSLVIRAKIICSANYFNHEIQLIKRYAVWNGFPRNIVNGIIKRALRNNDNNNTFNDNDIDAVTIYIRIKYSGETANRLIKQCIKKLYKCLKTEKRVKFVLQYETTKLSYFTNTKDKIPLLSQSSVVYKFVCPGCSSSYIGKTEHTLWERTEEHAYKNNNQKEQRAIYEHLPTCEHDNHIVDLFNADNNSFNLSKFNICQIRNNTTVIDKANNWNILPFKEAYMIKTDRPSLHCGLKASKELQLF